MKRTWYKRGRLLLEEIAATKPTEGQLAIWYLGQCGFVFKNQKTIYIDPVLNDLCGEDGLTRRHYTWPFEPEEVQADYVICTHNHLDHLALTTVLGIAKGDQTTKFVVPAGCTEVLTEAGIDKARVIGVNEKEVVELDGLTIRPVQAAHPVHEKDEQGRDLALSYSLRIGEVEVLHVGDTYLTDKLLADYLALPTPHIFFPPINGGDYFRTARNCIGNMNPLESARVAAMLHTDLTIPTHFDMVMDNTADPFLFAKLLWEENPSAKCAIPALGERILYQI